MKIAFIAYDSPGYHGGPIVNMRRLLPELQRRGHQVHALIQYHGINSPSAELLCAQGISVHAIPLHSWTEDNINWILECLARIQPDVFVPNLSVAGWLAARWAREAGIPTVAAYRSDDTFHAAMVETFVLGEPHWSVSGLVSVNKAACERIGAEKPSRTRLCTIPSGVPVPKTTANQQSVGEFRIVYVGRLVNEAKCILDLIDALAKALETLPNATATLIGHGRNRTDEAEVDCRIDELGMSGRIKRFGPVEPHRLHEVLIHFHILVLLSDYEGTPGSVMDGMACGLVPVCLDIPGGVRELVLHEQTGLLVADREMSFVSAIQRLAEDVELRVRLAANAQAHVRKGYSLTVAADRWEKFLETLLAEAGKRSTLIKPKRYDLPTVSPGLAREDHRRPNYLTRLGLRAWRTLRSWLRNCNDTEEQRISFLRPTANLMSMDRYLVRYGILKALRTKRHHFHGVVLDVGCGQMPYKRLLTTPGSEVKRYLGLDFANNQVHDNQPDICWDEGRIPLADSSVDSILCTEVLEHCPEPDEVLSEVARVLRPGGFLFFTVPFLWPMHEVPYDHYRYTPFSLRRHLAKAGFDEIDIASMGGWDASLAQMLGLWVRRRPMFGPLRFLISLLVYPLYRWLVFRDNQTGVKFSEGQMITGLWGTAFKPNVTSETIDVPDKY